ncbi:hypothetical protein ABTY96_23420 [Streptomyces sp. NPDC096057]|uniref:hypothetical protein n=1 Tax=Streptomyces sp. NPDC096057 TaxID=3155543 RepID=UPI00331DCC53
MVGARVVGDLIVIDELLGYARIGVGTGIRAALNGDTVRSASATPCLRASTKTRSRPAMQGLLRVFVAATKSPCRPVLCAGPNRR